MTWAAQPRLSQFWQGRAVPVTNPSASSSRGAFCDSLPGARRPGITELAMLFSARLLGDWFISMNNSIPALISSAIKA